jgi:hypothetical protein
MDFLKIKELEDLKSKLKSLHEQKVSIYLEKKREFANKTKEEFASFFNEKGFKTSLDKNVLEAKYGEYTITLTLSDENSSFSGCVTLYNFTTTQPKKSYKIPINFAGTEHTVTTSVTSQTHTISQEETVQLEINKLENDIKEVEIFLSKADNLTLVYTIDDKDLSFNTSKGNKLKKSSFSNLKEYFEYIL